jgi:hypothetical protein
LQVPESADFSKEGQLSSSERSGTFNFRTLRRGESMPSELVERRPLMTFPVGDPKRGRQSSVALGRDEPSERRSPFGVSRTGAWKYTAVPEDVEL